MVEKIKVVGVPGRVAFSAPTGGKRVPHDAPIIVARTAWVEARLLEGDIELFVEPKLKASAPAVSQDSGTNKGA